LSGGAKREHPVGIALGERDLQAAVRAEEPGEVDESKAAAKRSAKETATERS
jgi:hypothetical protein